MMPFNGLAIGVSIKLTKSSISVEHFHWIFHSEHIPTDRKFAELSLWYRKTLPTTEQVYYYTKAHITVDR